ncbi:MAG: nucleoside hydrolase, partial [Pseudomonadota bacterium]
MRRKLYHAVLLVALLLSGCVNGPSYSSQRIPLIVDTDANNELDDQHALAYVLFSQDVFNLRGITVNATESGGDIHAHVREAKRVLALCGVSAADFPLLSGANGSFAAIRSEI